MLTNKTLLSLIAVIAIQSTVIAYGFDPAKRQITQDTIDWGYAQKMNQIEPGSAPTSPPSDIYGNPVEIGDLLKKAGGLPPIKGITDVPAALPPQKKLR